MSITDIAAVTVHYNVAVHLSAAVRQVAEDAGIIFSPWHPGAVPLGHEGEPFHAAIDPIAEKYDASPQQIALAWQLHRTEQALPPRHHQHPAPQGEPRRRSHLTDAGRGGRHQCACARRKLRSIVRLRCGAI